MYASDHEIIVLLGSNSADAEEQMTQAFRWLKEQVSVTAMSAVYPSLPYDGTGPKYLNRVVKGTFTGSEKEFETIAKSRETMQGRQRESHTVAIDIDLITYDCIPVRPADMTREYYLQGVKNLLPV